MIFAGLLVLGAMRQDADFDPGPNPMLMRNPTLSATTIVFQYAGDLWSVPREGGEAKRLTNSPGVESNPMFSPDGQTIAFTAQYDGNTDVYTMPVEGGIPKRLTAHPADDNVAGWTPDGESVLFSSSMLSNTDYPRLFTVSKNGGIPKPLPLPAGVAGSFSPDGKQIAYVPNGKWQEAWKRYRGGQTTPIWVLQLSDSTWKSVPHPNTNDSHPMWIGDDIYYMSDPTGPVGLSRYSTKSGRVSVEIPGSGFDIKSASAGPGAIVYEKLGSIQLFDLKTHQSHRVPIQIHADFPEVRTEFKDVKGQMTGYSLSPIAQRVVIAARGWIFTAPASKGDIRLLDGKQGVNRHEPTWSPDGKILAYISDEDGPQMLALYDVATAKEKRLPLADSPGAYKNLVWSPDSKKIAYTCEKLTLNFIDIETGKNETIDRQTHRGRTEIQPAWSPDSKWLTWSRDLDNLYNAVFLYSLDSKKVTQITDGIADAENPIFDRDGKSLYFTVSTDVGLGAHFEDVSTLNAPNSTSSVYAVVLRKDLPNPLQPESDEEGVKPKTDKPEKSEKSVEAPKPVPFGIDLDGIEKRIIVLPMPRQGYSALEPGPAGSFFAIADAPRANAVSGGGGNTLYKFSFSDRKPVKFAENVNALQSSLDGSKLLLNQKGQLSIVPSAAPPAPGTGAIDLSGLKAKIDPRAEWRAMYHEVWAGERMLLYDPNLHGIDSAMMEKRYEPFLDNLATRDDLNYLFTDMLGELCVGHMFIRGGDRPVQKSVAGGLLGADYTFENGRYRLARIYDGERWNPSLTAPLAQPGVDAKTGEYLLAIDGKELSDAMDIYLQLEGKAGKQVKIKLGPTPDGVGSREVTVVPVANEFGLRFRAWAEDNRREVEKATAGKIGYVHVPDTGGGGFEAFLRYFYAQTQKQGLIVDDRFNHGGLVNDFMVNEMQKPLDFIDKARYGARMHDPSAAIYGPKVMLVNEMAGSGGDIFPYIFKLHKVGKLVGRRTWGAMISAYGFPLLDGGSVTAPDDAMMLATTGDWVIENEGTPPDIEVELDPYLWRQGRDAQLEAAIAEVLKQLANTRVPNPPLANFPDKSQLPPKPGKKQGGR
ncbi:MAG: PD40 domain-containing protein [Armatimonadetes bacterium]|nr:PD40 domain-containing protein [Armatimonadota bacterium]